MGGGGGGGEMWDSIVLVPDHCLSIYFTVVRINNSFPNRRSFSYPNRTSSFTYFLF